MYLKRIELNGFKSFNKRKEFIIKNGITGIVGPNGSGKSNIADAIRWVLGEQSSKNLRGSHMEDVIFNGSQELSQKGYCEVELIFDNSDMRIQSEYTEISVRRKMYRSGESEYSINNTGCRLKDILELFRDTGIGKEGYSIIGQGKIDEILSSKAIARRKVFEEAAGIMKYRVRKEEAERNLEKTRENILRLEDIIAELQSQIEPLEQQMQDAKRYMAFRERLKYLEVNLYLYNQERSADRIQKLNEQLLENEHEQTEAAEEANAVSAQLSALKADYQMLQSELDEYNRRIADFGSSQEKLRGELNLLVEKENNIRQRLGELAAQKESAGQSLDEKNQQLDELNIKIEELNAQIDEKHTALQKMREESERMTEGAGNVFDRYNTIKNETSALRDETEACGREVAEKKILLEMLRQKYEESQNALQSAGKSIESLVLQVKEKEQALGLAKEAGAALQIEAENVSSEIKSLREQQEKTNLEHEENKQQINQNRSTLNLLNEIKEGYEGYQASVRLLFGAVKEDPQLKQKLIGTFAELVSVPKKYETAIEAVLGNALQNVIVKNEEDAKAAIDYLRKNKLGRVTFLPLSALSIRRLTVDENKALGSQALCIASEITECADGIKPAVEFLLARTVIVEDMDNAIALMRKTGYTFRAVTLKGDIIRPGGVITGGSIETKQTGLLSRNRMIEELGGKIKSGETTVEKIAKQAQKIALQTDTKQGKFDQIQKELREKEIEATKIAQQLDSINDQLSDLKNKTEEMTFQQEQSGSQIADISALLSEKESALTGIQENLESRLAELASTEEEMGRETEHRSAMREELSKEEISKNELASQKNILLSEMEHIRSMIRGTSEQIELANEQTELLEKELKTAILIQKHETAEKLDDLTVQLKNESTVVQEKYAQRSEFAQMQADLETRLEKAGERKSGLIEMKYKIIANIEKTELIRENLENKIWDDYALTYANAQNLRGDFSYMNGTREIEEIKADISAMGPVNPNAIEDYSRVSERLDHLCIQRDDLIRAGEDLQVVIQSLLGDMKECFLEKFDKINSNFSEVFSQLFGGGHAEVLLMGDKDTDIMESGIEIIAEPPGKKLQNISLLSGGEKALTAIALLFAMLHINPSPVCLLDEIDAPLDEANVVRFSEYLKALSSGLQFIVITHRKPTMAVCDTLYGIAMHQKGVSEVVSVELN